jgi:predicted AlkP superfamily pyrophosphatase or phosphodiesterase
VLPDEVTFARAVFLVVDGLRYDFAEPLDVQDEDEPVYRNRLSFIARYTDPLI